MKLTYTNKVPLKELEDKEYNMPCYCIFRALWEVLQDYSDDDIKKVKIVIEFTNWKKIEIK